ncbi:DUF2269 family protein [Thiomicrorhabdus hydrogeniphila]
MQLIDLLAISIHIISATLWVGGIFLVYQVFRPAVMPMPSNIKLPLFVAIFTRFFKWVWLFIVLLIITGYLDWQYRFTATDTTPLYLHFMHILGWVMIILFAWLYFKPYQQLKLAVDSSSFPEAGNIINTKMRPIIIINLFLGIFEAIIGVTGPYW